MGREFASYSGLLSFSSAYSHLVALAQRLKAPLKLQLSRALAALSALLLVGANLGATVVAANTTGPVIQTITLAADNQTFTLTFDRPLGSNSQLAVAYGHLKLVIDGANVSYTGLGTSQGTNFITAKFPVVDPSKDITVVYTAPANNPATTNFAFQDVNGIDSASFSFSLRDETPPAPLSSGATSVSANQITIQFNETLLTSAPPLSSTLTVTQNGQAIEIDAVQIVASSLLITLSQDPVGPGTLEISYTAPAPDSAKTNSAIQDLAGNDALSFSLTAAVPAPDTERPALAATNQISFSGPTITLRFTEALLTSSPPLASQFYVYINGVRVNASSVSISGSTVLLTMPQSIATGSRVAVSYVPPTDDPTRTNSAIQDASGNDAIAFNAVTTASSGVWAWDPTTPHVAPNPTNGCDGAGSINRIKQTTLPNGVGYGVGVSGAHVCINEVTESLSQRGGEPQHFVSAGLVTEPGLKITTSHLSCNSALGTENLCSRGEVTIYFSQPVTNPVMSFSGLGGGQTANNVSSLSWTEFKLKTPSVSMNKLSGTNIQVVDSGTYLKLETNRPSTHCNITTNQYGATAPAGCGSIEFVGTMSSVTLEVFIGNYNGPGFMDAWNMTVNVAEDFGLVPVEMDSPVASHVVGDLRLGPTVEADQASALYGLTNPDAVPMGTSLHDHPKADDGVSAWIAAANATTSPEVDLVPGTTYTVTAAINGATSNAYICAWVDFNRDAVFGHDEMFCDTVNAGATSIALTWTVPANLQAGLIYTRVRLSTEPISSPLGKMNSGEVEDYSILQLELPAPPPEDTTPPPTASPDTSTGPYNTAQTHDVLDNDAAGTGTTLDATSVKLCGANDTAPNCTQTTLTVANQGTYTVNTTTGEITFTPLATFTGTATPVTYSVSDQLGQKVSTTYTPTVLPPPAPTASPDAITTGYDINQTYSPLANDSAGASDFPLLATSLKLCDPTTTPAQVSPNCTLTTLTIAGQGTYTVNADGTVLFDPLPTFTGTATAISYQANDSLNRYVTSTITPTITPPPAPTASPDTSSGPYNTPQTHSVLTNDAAGTGTTLDASSVKLCGTGETAPNCTLTTLTVAGEGTYAVNTTTGEITFTPVNGFIGTAAAITYSVSDITGQKVSTTYTPTVIGTPTANPDTTSGNQGETQTINLLTNIAGADTAATGATLDASTVKLCGAGETAPNCTKTEVVVAGVGTYSVDSSGVMTFTPLATYSGTPASLSYVVKDDLGQVATSTYTPSVFPAPNAVDDVSSGKQGQVQVISLIANDLAGAGSTLGSGAITLCDPGDGTLPPDCTQDTVVIAGVGTYSVDSSGEMTFTPLPNYSGTPTPLLYRLTDSSGQTDTATYTPTVVPPPTATADTSSGAFNAPQSSPVLTNDAPGSGTTLDATSVKLCAPGDTAPNCTQTTLSVADEGTYTVNPTTGAITFTPVTGFYGQATAVTYSVSDALGQKASTTYTPTVAPPAPTAVNDAISDAYDTNQVYNPIANDLTPAVEYQLDPTTLTLCGVGQTSPNCSATSLTVAGEGTYTVNTTTGAVTFDPLPSFVGTATPVSYQVSDSLGRTVTATITPTVGPPPAPTASPDAISDAHDTNQVYSPIANDTPGAVDFPLLASTLKLCDAGQTPPNCTATSLTVAGEGTYTVNTTTGVVTFDPLPTFVGVATPVSYQVSDSLGRTATATINPTVGPPPAPNASPDSSTGPYDTNQTINPLANDTAGATAFPLVATTVKLCDPESDPVEAAPDCTLTSLTIDGEGTYTVNTTTGVVTFDPLPTFTGPATQIRYQVSDSRNQVANSTINVSVSPPVAPALVDDYSTDIVNITQVFSITSNDVAAPGLTIDASTARLCADGETPNACTETSVTVAGVGTYTLAANGVITFVPVTDYVGEADPISYVVRDSFGQVATAQIYVVVTPTPKPLAVDDSSTDSVNRTQTINLLTNDSSPAGYPLVPGSVTLCGLDPAEASPNCTQTSVEIAEQGTLTISNGIVTFTPVANFVGEVDPVSYQVANSYGEKATAVIYITVTPAPVINETPSAPPAPPITAEQEPWPTATPDKNSGPLNSVISISPWLNDQQALSPLEAQSIMLCPNGCMLANGEVSTAMVTELRVAEGTWSVDPETGVVSFTPKHNWHGTVSVNYAIWAADGKMANSHLTVTIKPGERVQEPLAATGFDSQTLAIFALLLMLAGGLLISRGRRPPIPQGEDFSTAVPTRA